MGTTHFPSTMNYNKAQQTWAGTDMPWNRNNQQDNFNHSFSWIEKILGLFAKDLASHYEIRLGTHVWLMSLWSLLIKLWIAGHPQCWCPQSSSVEHSNPRCCQFNMRSLLKPHTVNVIAHTHSPYVQNWSFTIRCDLVSYSGHFHFFYFLLWGFYPSADKQGEPFMRSKRFFSSYQSLYLCLDRNGIFFHLRTSSDLLHFQCSLDYNSFFCFISHNYFGLVI